MESRLNLAPIARPIPHAKRRMIGKFWTRCGRGQGELASHFLIISVVCPCPRRLRRKTNNKYGKKHEEKQKKTKKNEKRGKFPPTPSTPTLLRTSQTEESKHFPQRYTQPRPITWNVCVLELDGACQFDWDNGLGLGSESSQHRIFCKHPFFQWGLAKASSAQQKLRLIGSCSLSRSIYVYVYQFWRIQRPCTASVGLA